MCLGRASVPNLSPTWGLILGWGKKLRSHTPDLTIKLNTFPESQHQMIDFSGLSRKYITSVCFTTGKSGDVSTHLIILAHSIKERVGCGVNIYFKYYH